MVAQLLQKGGTPNYHASSQQIIPQPCCCCSLVWSYRKVRGEIKFCLHPTLPLENKWTEKPNIIANSLKIALSFLGRNILHYTSNILRHTSALIFTEILHRVKWKMIEKSILLRPETYVTICLQKYPRNEYRMYSQLSAKVKIRRSTLSWVGINEGSIVLYVSMTRSV